MNESRLSTPARTIAFIPVIVLTVACAFLMSVRIDVATWEGHRDFWRGNPSEVYSHWLDMVLMSGNAFALAWLISAEAFFRRRLNRPEMLRNFTRWAAISTLVISGILGALLDMAHGEGTVIIVYPVLFVPILVSSYYLLRKIADHLRWNPNAVITICATFAALSVGYQLYNEPSETAYPRARAMLPIQSDHLFLWANSRFQYCDIRKLTRDKTEQMDQTFIDALIAQGGTRQTRLYSILWSPYMAGRVLKDQNGVVKAVCVINTDRR